MIDVVPRVEVFYDDAASQWRYRLVTDQGAQDPVVPTGVCRRPEPVLRAARAAYPETLVVVLAGG